MSKVQVKPYTLLEYLRAGCYQFSGSDDEIVIGLHGFTNGLMCNGCPYHISGCDAFERLSKEKTQAKIKPDVNTETVREESKRLGISISEVRRRRNESRITGSANESA